MQPPRLLVRATEVAGFALVMIAAACCGAHAGELYTHSPLTLHGGPGDGFAITDQVDTGSQIDVLWCNGSSSWCLVEHTTGQGWAPMTSLKPASASPLGSDDGSLGAEGAAPSGKPSDLVRNLADTSDEAGKGGFGKALQNKGDGDNAGHGNSGHDDGGRGNSGGHHGDSGRGDDGDSDGDRSHGVSLGADLADGSGGGPSPSSHGGSPKLHFH